MKLNLHGEDCLWDEPLRTELGGQGALPGEGPMTFQQVRLDMTSREWNFNLELFFEVAKKAQPADLGLHISDFCMFQCWARLCPEYRKFLALSWQAAFLIIHVPKNEHVVGPCR